MTDDSAAKFAEHLQEWREKTDRLIAVLQLVFGVGLSLVYFLTPKPDDFGGDYAVLTGLFLGLYTLLAICGAGFTFAIRKVPSWWNWFRLVTDIILLSLVIYSYQFQYGFEAAASLKAPTFLFYFVFVALQAMRFSPVHVLASGLMCSVGWAAITFVSLSSSGNRTHSYFQYVTTGDLLIGAEVEKIMVLLIFSALLTMAMHRARKALRAGMRARLVEEKARAEAELYKTQALSNAKSDFLSKISHEVRTPMNGIMGMVQVLEQRFTDSGDDEALETLRASSEEMMAILDNILDVTAIEHDDIVLAEEELNLADICAGVVKSATLDAAQKAVELRAEYPERELVVRGDARRIRSIFQHLICNAVRFTKAGCVEVVLGADLKDDMVEISFDVIDSGPGISSEGSADIFNLFEQQDNSKTRSHDGLGLGLSITRSLVSKMGGTVVWQNAETGGAHFTVQFSLPVVEMASADEQAVGQSMPAEHGANSENRQVKLLVAEDNAVNQLVLKTLLQSSGYDLIFADDGMKAVEAFESQHFDAIFMDLSMPNLDGVGAALEIRDMERAQRRRSIPIIALTAHISDKLRQECLEAGMNDYLTKPVKKDTLISTLSYWLDEEVRAVSHHESSASDVNVKLRTG